MAGLRIEYQRALLEIKTTSARFTIKNHHMPRFEAKSAMPRFQLDQQQQEPVSNDWEMVWAESGRRSARMQRQYYQQTPGQANAESTPQQGVILDGAQDQKQMVAEGQPMRPHRPRMARMRPAAQPKPAQPIQADPQLAQMTRARSRKAMSNDPGIKINWAEHLLEIKWDGLERPEIEWDPHSIEIKLKDHPSIQISFDPEVPKQFVAPADEQEG